MDTPFSSINQALGKRPMDYPPEVAVAAAVATEQQQATCE
jgi:hypothetical protein